MEEILFLDIDDVIVIKGLGGYGFELVRKEAYRIQPFYYDKKILLEDIKPDRDILKLLTDLFDPILVKRLLQILDATNAKIVVHSSWNRFPGIIMTYNALRYVGLKKNHFHRDIVPPAKFTSGKSIEINWWLQEYEDINGIVPSYVIIDDSRTSFQYYHRQDKIVYPKVDVGLTDADVDKAIKILNAGVA